MNKTINLNILENQNENAIEGILRYIERASLKKTISKGSKNDVEKIVLKIEWQLQDLEEVNTKFSKYFIEKVNHSLNTLIPILKSGITEDDLQFIKYFLHEISTLISEAPEIDINEINEIFNKLILEKEDLPKKISREDYVKIITVNFESAIEHFILPTITETDFWDLEIYISNKGNDNKSLFSLWLFIEILNQIKDIKIQIDEIKKGSIYSKIHIWFKSPQAKKEAEELLESTRKFAKGKLEKEFYENEKIKQEAEKITAEKEQIQNLNETEKSEFSIKKRELELKSLEIDIERKKLENEKLKLELFLNKKASLKELLVEDIINTEQYKISIKNQLFLEKKGSLIILGNDIKTIEEQ